jgi:hypothetical protein
MAMSMPLGRLWYGEPNPISNAIGYAMHRSRSHQAVICVYDAAGNVVETHQNKGDFKEGEHELRRLHRTGDSALATSKSY